MPAVIRSGCRAKKGRLSLHTAPFFFTFLSPLLLSDYYQEFFLLSILFHFAFRGQMERRKRKTQVLRPSLLEKRRTTKQKNRFFLVTVPLSLFLFFLWSQLWSDRPKRRRNTRKRKVIRNYSLWVQGAKRAMRHAVDGPVRVSVLVADGDGETSVVGT